MQVGAASHARVEQDIVTPARRWGASHLPTGLVRGVWSVPRDLEWTCMVCGLLERRAGRGGSRTLEFSPPAPFSHPPGEPYCCIPTYGPTLLCHCRCYMQVHERKHYLVCTSVQLVLAWTSQIEHGRGPGLYLNCASEGYAQSDTARPPSQAHRRPRSHQIYASVMR